MEPWSKFILYGTYGGFSRSTLGDDNLYLVLENGEKLEIPKCFVKNASDFVEKDKLKLKNIISRMEMLNDDTCKEWIDVILYEFGERFGTLKYRDGYEQGKIEGMVEREKVAVPQFVADWIEKVGGELFGLNYDSVPNEIYDWVYEEEGNLKKLHLACAIGYTVEKEKRYLVKMKGMDKEFTMFKLDKIRGSWYLGNDTEYSYTKTTHTRKELEEAGFGWVFDCLALILRRWKNDSKI